MSKFVSETYVNDIGQLIKPEDPVVWLASSLKITRIKEGIFRGVYYGEKRKIEYTSDGKYVSNKYYTVVIGVRVDQYVTDGEIWNHDLGEYEKLEPY